VHRLTAGFVGAAVLAAGGLTVMLAAGQNAVATTPTAVADEPTADEPTADDPTAGGPALGDEDRDDEEGLPAAGGRSGSLIAPAQPPAGSTGGGHVRTGGS
jgi:hypothetical protein